MQGVEKKCHTIFKANAYFDKCIVNNCCILLYFIESEISVFGMLIERHRT